MSSNLRACDYSPPGLARARRHIRRVGRPLTTARDSAAVISRASGAEDDSESRGELDRHLRRMRVRYRARRDALVAALEAELPEAEVVGIAAGLHVTVRLPYGGEDALREEAARRRILLETMRDFRPDHDGPLTLMLG